MISFISFIIFSVLNSFSFSSTNFSSPKETFYFHPPASKIILESGLFKIENDLYLFNAFFINPKTAKKNDSLPLIVHQMNQGPISINRTFTFQGTEHIRHYTKINTPWGLGVMFADHGIDNQELNQGGNVKLLVRNSQDKKLEDLSKKLNLKRNFTFNVVALKRKSQLTHDILLVPYNTETSTPIYLQATKDGYTDKSLMLPKEWTNKSMCFMTGLALDYDHDETDEIFLGGCDEDLTQKLVTRDKILKFKNNKWLFEREDILPIRKGPKGSGTAYLLKDDLNLDGYQDVIALTHDWGFHFGEVQILYNIQKEKKFKDLKIIGWPANILKTSHHYLHEVVAFDVNGDGKKDLIGQINYISQIRPISPNIFFLINNSDHFTYQKEMPLKIRPNAYIASIDVMKLSNNKNESLIITYHDGSAEVFTP